MNPETLLHAARVPETLRPQTFGLWTISRVRVPPAERPLVGFATQTRLERQTLATLHLDHGEIVMEDSCRELRRHLPIWLHAHGRVLVTGLGLGCVVRGLLVKPTVTHVDVIELDAAILERVGTEFLGHPRVTLHHGDALQFRIGTRRWDYGWHDLWSEEERLQILHAKILLRFAKSCRVQGAWGFPRCFKRIWPTPILQ